MKYLLLLSLLVITASAFIVCPKYACKDVQQPDLNCEGSVLKNAGWCGCTDVCARVIRASCCQSTLYSLLSSLFSFFRAILHSRFSFVLSVYFRYRPSPPLHPSSFFSLLSSSLPLSFSLLSFFRVILHSWFSLVLSVYFHHRPSPPLPSLHPASSFSLLSRSLPLSFSLFCWRCDGGVTRTVDYGTRAAWFDLHSTVAFLPESLRLLHSTQV